MRLVLVRHADPNYAVDGLTELGKRESAALGEVIRHVAPSRVFVSPLRRAHLTAGLAWAAEQESFEELGWLAELRLPRVDDGTGTVVAMWNGPADVLRCADGPRPQEAPQVSAAIETVRRGCDALLAKFGYERDGLDYIVRRATSDAVMLVGHAGTSMAMVSHLLGLDLGAVWSGFVLPPASVTTFVMESRDGIRASPRMVRLADVGHLARAGLPPNLRGLRGVDHAELQHAH